MLVDIGFVRPTVSVPPADIRRQEPVMMKVDNAVVCSIAFPRVVDTSAIIPEGPVNFRSATADGAMSARIEFIKQLGGPMAGG